MAKPSKNRERAERIEALRRESKRAERRRTLVVVLICGVLALAIVGATAWKLISDAQQQNEIERTDLADIGESLEAADCQDATTEPVEGSTAHVDPDQVDYPDSPPAFGPHWAETEGGAAAFARKFYIAEDRPELEQLVHNLEHGYTILWYDETVAEDSEQLQAVEDLGAKFDVGNIDIQSAEDLEQYNANKFIAAPWSADDGEPFPDGTHVALTRWVAEPGGETVGAWQYCGAPSGEAVGAFMAEYPQEESPEPDGV